MIPVEIKTETGIDVVLSSLITLSNGTQIEPPEFLRESEDKVTKNLSIRVHSCPFCGLILDRDHNAAINILKRSINTVGTTGIHARQGILNRGSMQRDAQALLGFG